MPRLRSLMCLLLLSACAVGCLRLLAADGPREEKLSPPVVLSGTHSQIKKETFKLITTAADWKTAWEEHHGKYTDREFTERDQSLDIDFSTHYVAAIFTGHCDWCEVTPRRRGDTVVIGFEACAYRTEGRPIGADKPDAQAEARAEREHEKRRAQAPYAFIVLPKPVRTVVIEQAVRRDLITPVTWKHRVTFPGAEEKK